MAAPQWSGGKWKTKQEVKSQFGHSINSRRKNAQHTNPHIDKSKTHLNFSYKGLSYRQCCEAYDKRMSEIDMGRAGSGVNARTLMQSVILYPPAGLIEDKARLRDWFVRAGQLAEARFGDNLIDIAYHFDEVHDYTEPKTKETRKSREHGHIFLVPEVAGKLNGKQFSCRKTIVDFNDELQDMSIREFGCPMMDGSKAKGGRRVEDMKAASRAAEIIAQAEKQAQETAQKAQEEAEAQARVIIAQAQRKAQEAAQEAEERLQRTEQQLAELEPKLAEYRKAEKRYFSFLDRANKEADAIRASADEKVRDLCENAQIYSDSALAILGRAKRFETTFAERKQIEADKTEAEGIALLAAAEKRKHVRTVPAPIDPVKAKETGPEIGG